MILEVAKQCDHNPHTQGEEVTDISHLISELEQQRSAIERAISALRGIGSGDNRSSASDNPGNHARGRKRFSAATRKRMAEAQRKRWAKRKTQAA